MLVLYPPCFQYCVFLNKGIPNSVDNQTCIMIAQANDRLPLITTHCIAVLNGNRKYEV